MGVGRREGEQEGEKYREQATTYQVLRLEGMKWPGVELNEGRWMIRRAKEKFEKEEKHMVLKSDSYISLTHSLTPSY